MHEEMPKVASVRAQTATREETEALLDQIAHEAATGAAQINAACIVLSRLMLMQEVGIDRTPLYPGFQELMAARDSMVQAVVGFREILDELAAKEDIEEA